MANVSSDEIRRLADLVRIDVSDEEVSDYDTYVNRMLTYAEGLNAVDTDGIEPTISVVGLQNVFRKDEAEHTITQEEALKNAPDQADGQFRVPSILE